MKRVLFLVVVLSLLAVPSYGQIRLENSDFPPAKSNSPKPNLPSQHTLLDKLQHQPDFTADEVRFSGNRESTTSMAHRSRVITKKAKHGCYYRTESINEVTFSAVKGAKLLYTPNNNQFTTLMAKFTKWYAQAPETEIWFQRTDLVLEEVGHDEVSGHNCTKIKVTAPQSSEPTTIVFLYMAEDLQNLVVSTQIQQGDIQTAYILSNITLGAKPELFQLAGLPPCN